MGSFICSHNPIIGRPEAVDLGNFFSSFISFCAHDFIFVSEKDWSHAHRQFYPLSVLMTEQEGGLSTSHREKNPGEGSDWASLGT